MKVPFNQSNLFIVRSFSSPFPLVFSSSSFLTKPVAFATHQKQRVLNEKEGKEQSNVNSILLNSAYKSNCVNKAFLQFFLYNSSFSNFSQLSTNLPSILPQSEGRCLPKARKPVALVNRKPSAFLKSRRGINNHSGFNNQNKKRLETIQHIVNTFNLGSKNTYISVQSFFPYRKAFLTYWLCPFVGFMYTLQSFNNFNGHCFSPTSSKNEVFFFPKRQKTPFFEKQSNGLKRLLTQNVEVNQSIPLGKDQINLNSPTFLLFYNFNEEMGLVNKHISSSSFQDSTLSKNIRWPLLFQKESLWLSKAKGFQMLENNSLTINVAYNSNVHFGMNPYLTSSDPCLKSDQTMGTNQNSPFMLKMCLFNNSNNSLVSKVYTVNNPQTSYKKASILLDSFIQQKSLILKENQSKTQFYLSKKRTKTEDKLSKKDLYQLLSLTLQKSLLSFGSSTSSLHSTSTSWSQGAKVTSDSVKAVKTSVKTSLEDSVKEKIISLIYTDLKIPVMSELGLSKISYLKGSILKQEKQLKYFQKSSEMSSSSTKWMKQDKIIKYFHPFFMVENNSGQKSVLSYVFSKPSVLQKPTVFDKTSFFEKTGFKNSNKTVLDTFKVRKEIKKSSLLDTNLMTSSNFDLLKTF